MPLGNEKITEIRFRMNRIKYVKPQPTNLLLFARKAHPCLIKQTYRISIFGDGHVGKTEIARSFIDHEYIEDYQPTIEEFYSLSYNFKNVAVNLEIVDTCGTEQFPAMIELNIKKSDVVILVYDVGKDSTIKEVVRLYSIVRDLSLCPIVIAGAKGDTLPDMYGYRDETIHLFLQNLNDIDLTHTVCSSKENYNIERIFEMGLQSIIPSIDEISEDLQQWVSEELLSKKCINSKRMVKRPSENKK